MSGIQLIEKLKANPATAVVPVIMCTGMLTTSQNLRIALDAGAVHFVRKPIDAIELLARIRSMLVLIDSFDKIRKQKEELLRVVKSGNKGKNCMLKKMRSCKAIWKI